MASEKPASDPWKTACVTSPALNPRLPNSRIGSSEDPVRRSVDRCVTTKMASTTTDPPIIDQAQAGHPCDRPWISGNTSRNRPSVASTTPGTSMRCALADAVLGTKSRASTNRAIPTGTLIRKMLRQPTPNAS